MSGVQANAEVLHDWVGPYLPFACWRLDRAGQLHPLNALAEAASRLLDAESVRAIVSGREPPPSPNGLQLRRLPLGPGETEVIVAARQVSVRERALARARRQWKLTDRELEVLDLLADGHSQEEAAGKLGIAPYTVRKHVTHMHVKAGCDSSVEMVGKLLRMI